MLDIFNPSSRPHEVLSISCFALRVQRENKQLHLLWSCSLGSSPWSADRITACPCLRHARVLFLGKSKIGFFNPKTDFPFFKWINSRSFGSWCSKRTEETSSRNASGEVLRDDPNNGCEGNKFDTDLYKIVNKTTFKTIEWERCFVLIGSDFVSFKTPTEWLISDHNLKFQKLIRHSSFWISCLDRLFTAMTCRHFPPENSGLSIYSNNAPEVFFACYFHRKGCRQIKWQ